MKQDNKRGEIKEKKILKTKQIERKKKKQGLIKKLLNFKI